MSTMLAHYKASERYIMCEQTLLGDSALQETQDAQLSHLLGIFINIKPTVSEASDMQEQLCQPSNSFSEEHRKTLGQAVGKLMRATTTDKPSHNSKMQDNKYFYYYLTDSDWITLLDPTKSMKECQKVLANRGMAIGFVAPSPLNFVAMQQIIYVAKNNTEHPYDMQYAHKNELVHIWTAKARHAGMRLLSVYPATVADFTAACPNCYSASDPPVAPRIPITDVLEGASMAPCRNTHRTVRRTTGKQTRAQGMPELMPAASLRDSITDAILQRVLQDVPLAKADTPPSARACRAATKLEVKPEPAATPTKDEDDDEFATVAKEVIPTGSSKSPAAMQCIPWAIAEPVGARTVVAADAEAPANRVLTLQDMREQVEASVKAKAEASVKAKAEASAKAKADATGKAKAEARKDNVADDLKAPIAVKRKQAAVAAAHEPAHPGAVVPEPATPAATRRRLTTKTPPGGAPRAVAPRTRGRAPKAEVSAVVPYAASAPSAAAGGVIGGGGERPLIIPAAADCWGHARPPVRRVPTAWQGGKIYFSKAKHAFRCYKRRLDKIETTCRIGGRAEQDAWDEALDRIVNDPRPRD